MFPNVRLLIGALLASVVALSCGFGLFAAFRVNHEPLSQLPVGNSSAQLVANEVAAPRTGWGTPFDGQSRLNNSQHSEPVTEIPPARPVSQTKAEASGPATVGAIKPAPVSDAVQHDAAQPAAAAPTATPVPTPIIAAAPPASEPAEQTTSAAPGANGATETAAPAPSASAAVPAPADGAANPASSAPDQTASVPSLSVNAPAPTAAAIPSPDAVPAQATTATASPPAAPEQSVSAAPATSSPPPQNPVAETEAATPASAAQQDTGADSGEAAKAPAPAIATATTDQSSAVTPPGEKAEPANNAVIAPVKAAAKPTDKVEAKKQGKAVRRLVVRRRVAGRKRIVRRWRARATVQNSGFNDPVFRSAPDFSNASASRGSNSSGWANGQ